GCATTTDRLPLQDRAYPDPPPEAASRRWQETVAGAYTILDARKANPSQWFLMPQSDKFRIALIQTDCAIDPNQNLAKTEWKIREAAAGGAQIICTQELFRSQYFCREEN